MAFWKAKAEGQARLVRAIKQKEATGFFDAGEGLFFSSASKLPHVGDPFRSDPSSGHLAPGLATFEDEVDDVLYEERNFVAEDSFEHVVEGEEEYEEAQVDYIFDANPGLKKQPFGSEPASLSSASASSTTIPIAKTKPNSDKLFRL